MAHEGGAAATAAEAAPAKSAAAVAAAGTAAPAAAAAAAPSAAAAGAPAAAAAAAAAEAAPAAAAAGATEEQLLGRRLLDAARAGDLDALRAALGAGADVAWADAEGTSPLMAAAEEGHTQAVIELLEAGAPWNQLDATGYCAGEYAGASKRQDIVELLMEYGVQAELLLSAAERRDGGGGASTSAGDGGGGAAAAAANAAYLQQKLTYSPDGSKLLDADGEAVMMGWETPLMERHAAVICGSGGGHYLNVGFGLGIIDTFIQGYSPVSHTIVEPHPDVLAHMLQRGWDKKPGVRILHGRWQDVLPHLAERCYDGVFFDTYGEYFEEMHAFHAQLPRLLSRGGVYSYFNGLASDNLFFHAVYGRLVQVELAGLGLATSFEQLRIGDLGDEVWQGVRSKYWRWPHYFLPRVVHQAAEAQGAG